MAAQPAAVQSAGQRATMLVLPANLYEGIGEDAGDLFALDLVPLQHGVQVGGANARGGASIALHAVRADRQQSLDGGVGARSWS